MEALPLLKMVIPACPPSPALGGVDIVGGCVAFTLDSIHQRLVRRRDYLAGLRLPDDLEAVVNRMMARRREFLAERQRQPTPRPYDREACLAELREEKELRRLQADLGRHREHLRLLAEIPEVEDAIRRGEGLEAPARIYQCARSEVERWCSTSMIQGMYEWVECRGCGQRYTPKECSETTWGLVADPLAAIGGYGPACPAGHVIYMTHTWVA